MRMGAKPQMFLFLMSSNQRFEGRSNFFISLSALYLTQAYTYRTVHASASGPSKTWGDSAPALSCGKFVFLHSTW